MKNLKLLKKTTFIIAFGIVLNVGSLNGQTRGETRFDRHDWENLDYTPYHIEIEHRPAGDSWGQLYFPEDEEYRVKERPCQITGINWWSTPSIKPYAGGDELVDVSVKHSNYTVSYNYYCGGVSWGYGEPVYGTATTSKTIDREKYVNINPGVIHTSLYTCGTYTIESVVDGSGIPSGEETYIWYRLSNRSTRNYWWRAHEFDGQKEIDVSSENIVKWKRVYKTEGGWYVSSPSNTVEINLVTQDPGIIRWDENNNDSKKVCHGTEVGKIKSLSSGGAGEGGTIEYNWYKSTNNDNELGTHLGGGNGSVIEHNIDTTLNPGTYYYTRTFQSVEMEGCEEVWDENSRVKVEVKEDLAPGEISFDENLYNITVCYDTSGGVIQNESSASGDFTSDNVDYQWEKNTGNGWEEISGATDTIYDIPRLRESTDYRRRATTKCKSKTTNEIRVRVLGQLSYGKIKIADKGEKISICSGKKPPEIKTKVNVRGGAESNSKWQKSNDGDNWDDISGENKADYYQPGELTQTTYYRKRVEDDCGSGNSNVVTVNIYPDLTAGEIKVEKDKICYNDSLGTIKEKTQVSGGNENSYVYRWEWKTENSEWHHYSDANNKEYEHKDITSSRYIRRGVKDECSGGDYEYTQPVYIEIDNINADFRVKRDTIKEGEYVQFINKSTRAEDYEWVISEVGKRFNESPYVYFNKPGFKNVNLIIESDIGCYDEIQKDNVVYVKEKVKDIRRPETDISTNIYKKDVSEVSIYPNPVKNGIFYINSQFPLESIKLYNKQGILIKTIKGDRKKINLKNIDSGMYIVELKIKNSLIRKKIIVK